MWNDTDFPLAYFITFRTYGTWLHGDGRGSVNRFRNTYRTARLPNEPSWLNKNRSRMNSEPVTLDAKQRVCVEKAIRETCSIRGWSLQAINVRTNHVHAVVTAGTVGPGKVINALKANATRTMREAGVWDRETTPWVDKGSTRYLWNEDSLAKACDYVMYDQGEELPEF